MKICLQSSANLPSINLTIKFEQKFNILITCGFDIFPESFLSKPCRDTPKKILYYE